MRKYTEYRDMIVFDATSRRAANNCAKEIHGEDGEAEELICDSKVVGYIVYKN